MRPLLLTAAIALVGCGHSGGNPANVVAVCGLLTAADGKPARFVSLEFVPKEPGLAPAYAESDAEGKFSPTTMNNQAGMVPGAYKVVARATRRAGATAVRRQLGDDQTTTVEATVGKGDLAVQLK